MTSNCPRRAARSPRRGGCSEGGVEAGPASLEMVPPPLVFSEIGEEESMRQRISNCVRYGHAGLYIVSAEEARVEAERVRHLGLPSKSMTLVAPG